MPIKILNDLPVREILEKENIFVVDENRAMHQDIRSLNICILNLMLFFKFVHFFYGFKKLQPIFNA